MQFEKAIVKKYITGNFVLPKSYVLDQSFESKEIKDCTITNGSLSCSYFNDCSFQNVIFINVVLEEVHFKHCKFQNTTLENCKTEGLQFENCEGEAKIK